MIRLSGETRLSAEELIAKAIAFFGSDLGLEITGKSRCCVTFEGGGGQVTMNIDDDAGETKVELSAVEWEEKARDFLSMI